MERDGFIFYRSFWDGIKNLPDDIRSRLITCIMEYGLDGKEPQDGDPIVMSVFALIKPQIDANNKKYENGKKGGRPKNQTETTEKPNKNQTITKQKPRNNQSETNPKPKEKDKVKDNDKEKYNKENTTNVVLKKDAAKAATLTRKEDFYQSLVPYVGQYPKEMIREFFDYWSEMNKSETKMRYEQQPTWEVSKRLATWAKKDNNYGKRTYDIERDSEQRKFNSAVAVSTRVQEAAAKRLAELKAEGVID